jgi:hypothetical protein
VMDLAALAPDDEPEPVGEVMDLAALAPDDEPEPAGEVMDLAALAPDDEPEPAGEVMDLAALAPDDEPEPAGEVMDLAALAPDDEPEPVGEVMDLAALAPDDEPEPVGEVMDLAALAPDAEEEGELEPEPLAEPEEERTMGSSEPVYTRTLAELYVKQGFVAKALGVYRHLLRAQPDATDIRDRIAELERGGAQASGAVASAKPSPSPMPTPSEAPDRDEERVQTYDDEVETLARDLASGGDDTHEVDSPFAWADEAASAPNEPVDDEGPGIGEYFDDLLGWEDRGAS